MGLTARIWRCGTPLVAREGEKEEGEVSSLLRKGEASEGRGSARVTGSLFGYDRALL